MIGYGASRVGKAALGGSSRSRGAARAGAGRLGRSPTSASPKVRSAGRPVPRRGPSLAPRSPKIRRSRVGPKTAARPIRPRPAARSTRPRSNPGRSPQALGSNGPATNRKMISFRKGLAMGAAGVVAGGMFSDRSGRGTSKTTHADTRGIYGF